MQSLRGFPSRKHLLNIHYIPNCVHQAPALHREEGLVSKLEETSESIC